MLDSTSTNGSPPAKPPKQLLVDWIVQANNMIGSNHCIVKKSFLVTGLSNALGGHEDHLIRNDLARKEIDEVIAEVFGEESMGFQEPESEQDPFETSSDEEASDDEAPDSSSIPDSSATYIPTTVYDDEPDSTTGSDSDSISAPEFEPLSSDDEFSC